MFNSKALIVALVAFVCLVTLLMFPQIIGAILVFVFMGVIPGSSATIPSWVTLGAMSIALIIGIRWMLDQPVYRPFATSKDLARRATARRKVLRATRIRNTSLAATTLRKAARVKA